MNSAKLQQLTDVDAFVALLKSHNLFRDDDVTFDDIGAGNMYVYTGDDFVIDEDELMELGYSDFLIVGDLTADLFEVSAVLEDCGTFCVTGNVNCKNMLYETESTGVGIGGDLIIGGFFLADCGNSVLQVNGDVTAVAFINLQCTVDVGGQEYDPPVNDAVLAAANAVLGTSHTEPEEIEEAIRDHIENGDD